MFDVFRLNIESSVFYDIFYTVLVHRGLEIYNFVLSCYFPVLCPGLPIRLDSEFCSCCYFSFNNIFCFHFAKFLLHGRCYYFCVYIMCGCVDPYILVVGGHINTG